MNWKVCVVDEFQPRIWDGLPYEAKVSEVVSAYRILFGVGVVVLFMRLLVLLVVTTLVRYKRGSQYSSSSSDCKRLCSVVRIFPRRFFFVGDRSSLFKAGRSF